MYALEPWRTSLIGHAKTKSSSTSLPSTRNSMNLHRNNRILLIDDNRGIHNDFRKIFHADVSKRRSDEFEDEFFGKESRASIQPPFDLESAYQGEDGLAQFTVAAENDDPFAIAFVDVRMPPGIDGIETTKRLWEIDPDVQIVICTAYSDYSWQQMTERLGMSDRLLVLRKPFTSIEVLQTACALSTKWALTRQARTHLEETRGAVEERTQELRASNERLEGEILQREQTEKHLLRSQRLESIGTLAGGIAHDLNNLISPILLSAQLLSPTTTEKMHEELVSIVINCAERASGIIKQLLTFARGIDGERIPLQLRFLIQEIEQIASETFPRLITIRTSVAADLRTIEGDATPLQQVLMNLCVNARDAMPDGGSLRISAENVEVDEAYASMVVAARPGTYVRLRVADTGIGIPEEQINKIFDPFFTTKPIGKGSGLGLSSVSGIVKSHGGFLEVDSKPGKGTTFDVFLPAASADAHCAPPESASEEIPSGSGQLILVVDDESDIRIVMQATLTRHGYSVITAEGGTEALTIYAERSREIAAVVTDLIMPVVDGVALCRALRRINPACRIIMSTGEGEHHRQAELSSLRLCSMLNKPFTANTLMATVGRVLA